MELHAKVWVIEMLIDGSSSLVVTWIASQLNEAQYARPSLPHPLVKYLSIVEPPLDPPVFSSLVYLYILPNTFCRRSERDRRSYCCQYANNDRTNNLSTKHDFCSDDDIHASKFLYQ